MTNDAIRSESGRPLNELNMAALRAGALTADDFRISAETLNRQAATAEAAGYRQLADNLRRAAELTALSHQEVFDIYNALRPGRSTYEELIGLARHLEGERNMPRVASFIREAAEAYRRRGIVRTP
jgi:propanediol dehydratase small subunit